MKPNEAPENLYLSSTGKLKDGISTGRFCGTNIEYTRTDAFIEKAKKWFEKQNEWFDPNGNRHCDMDDFEDFKNYMKGE